MSPGPILSDTLSQVDCALHPIDVKTKPQDALCDSDVCEPTGATQLSLAESFRRAESRRQDELMKERGYLSAVAEAIT